MGTATRSRLDKSSVKGRLASLRALFSLSSRRHLRGVWATAPYLHNGSVPTLEDLLDYDTRAARVEEGSHLWTFEPGAYDQGRVGLVATFLPPEERTNNPRLHDSKRRGMSAQGHDFGSGLDAEERRALLEYLKTL